MRRALLVGAMVAAALIAPASASAGTVSGDVTPVSIAPEVYVCVVEIGAEPEACEAPGVDGHYILSAPVGPVEIEFIPSHHSGYLPQYYRLAKRLQEATTVFVPSPPGEVSGIDAELELGGDITGTVAARSGGAPLREIEVCAVEPGAATPVSCAQSDAAGEYTITSLPTGSYKVRFQGGGVSAGYAEGFYDGAIPVEVEAGQTQTGIDAELAKGAEVIGTVSTAVGGGRLADVPVCLFRADQASATQCAFTDALGDYALQGIAAGSYQVGFSLSSPTIGGETVGTEDDGYLSQYFDGVANRSEARTLNLSGEQVANDIDAALVAPTTPPPPPPPPPVTSNVVAPPVLITEPVKPKPLKCKKGFVKKKVKAAAKCVKKPAKKHRKKAKKHTGHGTKAKGPKGKTAKHGKG